MEEILKSQTTTVWMKKQTPVNSVGFLGIKNYVTSINWQDFWTVNSMYIYNTYMHMTFKNMICTLRIPDSFRPMMAGDAFLGFFALAFPQQSLRQRPDGMPWGCFPIPSGEVTYPTNWKGISSSQLPFGGDMWASGRVYYIPIWRRLQLTKDNFVTTKTGLRNEQPLVCNESLRFVERNEKGD